LTLFAATVRKGWVRKENNLLFLEEILFFSVCKDGVLGYEVMVGDVDEEFFLHEGFNHEWFAHFHILNLSSLIKA